MIIHSLLVALACAALPWVPPGDVEAELAIDSAGYHVPMDLVPHVVSVSKATGVDAAILASIVAQESANGKPWILRQCDEWEPVEGGKRCVRQSTCWRDCTDEPTWSNRLDCGMWGIRDAPRPGSSWLRRYRRVTGKDVDDLCPMRPRCASRLMAWIVKDLHRWTPRDCDGPCGGLYGWLSRWNGCRSCNNHIHRAALKHFMAWARWPVSYYL